MTRLERIRAYVEQRCAERAAQGAPPHVEVQEVAEALSIWRNDASKDLNLLVEQGVLTRQGKRPIRFSAAPPGPAPAPAGEAAGRPLSRRAFASVIGANGSLRSQVRTAKSALLYPPMGLHALIVGETGVGKTMLAEEMWRYAQEVRAFGGGDIPFVRFNCAEYADNPQLLLSQLFGHLKNSFTGAGETKPGLVEKADGGILFLDEIHRLPSTGQELLFTLLDKSTYRRLGDTADRSASLMLIGSTSHDHVTALLDTFKRRIPVLIRLPNLDERPPNERLALIRHFFSLEAQRLGRDIRVSGRALRVLMLYRGRANIGELRNAVQLCCAKRYLERQTGAGQAAGPLDIDVYHLSQSVYDGAAGAPGPDCDPLGRLYAEGLRVTADEYGKFARLGDESLSLDLFHLLEDNAPAAPPERAPAAPDPLQDYYDHTLQALQDLEESRADALHARILPGVWEAAGRLLDLAGAALGRRYGAPVRLMLAMHLQQFLERSRAGQIIYNPGIRDIQAGYPAELEFLHAQLPWLTEALAAALPEDELGFLILFLRDAPAGGDRGPWLLLVSGEEGRARRLADGANRALGAPLLRWSGTGRARGEALVRALGGELRRAGGAGALVLTDLELLPLAAERLERESGAPCRVLPGLSPALALAAGALARGGAPGLEALSGALGGLVRADLERRLERMGPPVPPEGEAPFAVITVCASGEGSAVRMKELLERDLPFSAALEIIPMGVLDDVAAAAKGLGSRLRLILGAMDPEVPGAPFLHAEALFSYEGLSRIGGILLTGRTEEEARPPLDRKEFLALVERSIPQFAPSMDPRRVMELSGAILDRLEETFYHDALPIDVTARLIVHTASMLERLGAGAPLKLFRENRETIRRQQRRFEALDGVLQEVLSPAFGPVPEAEVYYFLVSLP